MSRSLTGTGGQSYDLSTLKGANAFISLKSSNMKRVGDISKRLAKDGICFQKCVSKFQQVYQFHAGIVTESSHVPYKMWDTYQGEVITKNDVSFVCAYDMDWACKYFGV